MFALALTVSEILNFFLRYKIVLKLLGLTFTMASFFGIYPIWKSCFVHFYASFYCFIYINSENVWPSKWRSRSWNTIFAMISFDGKCQNLQAIPTHFVLALSVSGILKFEIFYYLQKVDQRSQSSIFIIHYSMTNGEIYNDFHTFLC